MLLLHGFVIACSFCPISQALELCSHIPDLIAMSQPRIADLGEEQKVQHRYIWRYEKAWRDEIKKARKDGREPDIRNIKWEGAGAAPLLDSMKVEGPSPRPVKPEGLGTKVVASPSGRSHEAPPQHLGSLYLAWKAGWKPSSEQEWKQLQKGSHLPVGRIQNHTLPGWLGVV